MLKNFFEHTDYNTPVYETSNFVVIPTLGALIEGWLLIVPKAFYLNFSQLPSAQLKEVEQIILHLEERFLPLFKASASVLFEHGPSSVMSTAGCGVDYAHLHWVPTKFDLKKGLLEYLNLDFDWTSIHGLSDITSSITPQKDYLYLKDQNGKSFVSSQSTVPSQTFRKVIAHYIQRPEQFDWKSDFGSENIKAVYSKLSIEKV